jgi:hypothetical protein
MEIIGSLGSSEEELHIFWGQLFQCCIEDSVESRIIQLQEKKANLIRGTLNKDQAAAFL